MSLTAKDVEQITRLLEESNFDELYLEIDGLKLSLRRGSAANGQSLAGSASALAPSTPPASQAGAPATRAGPGATPTAPTATPTVSPAAASAPPAATPAAAPPSPDEATDPNTLSVSAPLLGTFYRAPKPGAPAFVEIGSPVEENTIVGIIEVMKLMNTVRAGVRGKVIQILGRDGALVEYGETLMRVSKTS